MQASHFKKLKEKPFAPATLAGLVCNMPEGMGYNHRGIQKRCKFCDLCRAESEPLRGMAHDQKTG